MDSDACRRRLEACSLYPKEYLHHRSLKQASVLVLLWEIDGEVQTLITQRSHTLRSHPGECCFPGGRQDEGDRDAVATALREAYEEVGLDPKDVTPLSCLRTVESLHHLCVTPVVAWLENSSFQGKWKMNASEVQAVFHVPLQLFLKPPVSSRNITWSGEDFVLRKYQFTPNDTQITYSITGLTAHIAHEVAHIAFGCGGCATLATCVRNRPSDNVSISQKSGYLWKQEVSSRGRIYWTRRYFVLSSNLLHHYDSENTRKLKSANKKHRLVLTDLKQTRLSMTDQERYTWKVETLDGRLVWHLSSDQLSSREDWISCLYQCASVVPK